MPEKTEALFAQLMEWLNANVDKRYWSTINPDYNAEKEVRETVFQNLFAEFLQR